MRKKELTVSFYGNLSEEIKAASYGKSPKKSEKKQRSVVHSQTEK